MENLLISLIIGLIAGWLASILVTGGSYGVVGDMVIGLIGSLVGGVLFRSLGIYTPADIWGSILVSFIGASVLLIIAKVIKTA
jgi:uncharacterized membrane protein YeaQ/YmgE (transglycosylase-associated protein family)